MEQKRFATQNFYMEAIVDGDRIVSLVGCSAEVEMVEMNTLKITTAKSQMYFELGPEINWLSEETDVIFGMQELLDDYDLYRNNVENEVYQVSPKVYLDEFENCVRALPVPLKEYFLRLHNEYGPGPVNLSFFVKSHLKALVLAVGIAFTELRIDETDEELIYLIKALDWPIEVDHLRTVFHELAESLNEVVESDTYTEMPEK